MGGGGTELSGCGRAACGGLDREQQQEEDEMAAGFKNFELKKSSELEGSPIQVRRVSFVEARRLTDTKTLLSLAT
jgi:hypothetical protein